MSRPQKAGMEYFPCDVDIFDDDKLFDVSNEFGPLGEVIYIRLLCIIYKNGYYYKFDSLDKLASILIKSIGNKWARDKQSVMQVIPFLAKCNLFSSELMQENVLTSASIQRRYLKATERRQTMNSKEYWLLDSDNSRIIVTKNDINVGNNQVNVYNNSENVDIGTQSKVKKSKVNNIYLSHAHAQDINEIQFSQDLKAFLSFHKDIKIDNYGAIISDIDFNALHNEIENSKWLKQITSFSWLCQNYEKIISGKYKDIQTDKRTTPSDKPRTMDLLKEIYNEAGTAKCQR